MPGALWSAITQTKNVHQACDQPMRIASVLATVGYNVSFETDSIAVTFFVAQCVSNRVRIQTPILQP